MSDPARDPIRKRGLPVRVKMRHDNHFVEELTARHETPVGKMIPLAAIEPDPDQPPPTMGDPDGPVASLPQQGAPHPVPGPPQARPLSARVPPPSTTP